MIKDGKAPAGWLNDRTPWVMIAGLAFLALLAPPLLLPLLLVLAPAIGLIAAGLAAGRPVPAVVFSPVRALASRAPPRG